MIPAAKSEVAITAEIRLEASRHGWRLWRNNSGAYQDETGRLVRYGLANESAQVNRGVKSADLIGIAPHLITPGDVGRTIGIFASVEAKSAGWTSPRNARERAQAAWRDLVLGLGGYAIMTGDPREVFGYDPRT
jgi:hypothetical protein